MILAALLLSTPLIEVIDPGSRVISIQAVAMLPDLPPPERDLLPELVRRIPRATEEYNAHMMSDLGSGPPICTLSPDSIRVGVTVDRDRLTSGLDLMDNLLTKALLKPETEPPAPRSLWDRALWPVPPAPETVRDAELTDLYHRIFRTENLTLAVGGPIVPGDAQARWAQHVERWVPVRPLMMETGPATATQPVNGNSPLGVIDIGRPVDRLVSADLLALIALGCGKGGSLFQVVRQRMGLSYQLQAVLSPDISGFRERLVITTFAEQASESTAKSVQTELLKDVDGWTEVQRQRALGMAQAILLGSREDGPFFFSGDRSTGNSLADRTFLAAYWKAKTGANWDAMATLNSLRDVPLDALQARARDICSGSLQVFRL